MCQSELKLNKGNSPIFGFTFIYFRRICFPKLMISVMIFIFVFDRVNVPFLDGGFTRCTSTGVIICLLIRFATVSHTSKSFFSKFYHRCYALFFKFNVDLKHFNNKAYRNQNVLGTKSTNSKQKQICKKG